MRPYLSEAFLNVPKGCHPQSQVLSPGIFLSPLHTGWLHSYRTFQNQRSSDWTHSLSMLATQPHGFLSTVWDLRRTRTVDHYILMLCVLAILSNWEYNRCISTLCTEVPATTYLLMYIMHGCHLRLAKKYKLNLNFSGSSDSTMNYIIDCIIPSTL